MAQLPVNFDATQVAPSVALEALPAGWYKAQITGSEMKPTSKGDGSYLQLEHTILEGEFAGRKVYNNLNLVNPNETAKEIAYRTLSAICHAVGIFQVTDTQALHGIPLNMKLKVEAGGKGADGNTYEARNAVSGYEPLDGAAAPAISGAPVTAAAPSWAAAPVAVTATTTPATVAAPAPGSAPTPAKHGLEAAVADGWIPHPDSPGWHYKGQEVKSDADVAAMYPLPVAAPATPATPSAPAVPAGVPSTSQPTANPAAAATPPWVK